MKHEDNRPKIATLSEEARLRRHGQYLAWVKWAEENDIRGIVQRMKAQRVSHVLWSGGSEVAIQVHEDAWGRE